MLKYLLILLLHFPLLPPLATKHSSSEAREGLLKITFVNVVDTAPMVLRSADYVNPFGETYSISKFKYYISNITLQSPAQNFAEKESYHLINQDDPASLSFSFPLPAGNYSTFSFLLGVDSLHNVSGAQTDALDAANDMFWTWNSGYVMAKIEGNSPASAFNNFFEFHVGGFSGPNNVLKNIHLNLPPNGLLIRQDKTSEIIIRSDAGTWWQKPYDLKIAVQPNITAPGLLAKKISDNYSKMFTVKEVINN